jgi:transposase
MEKIKFIGIDASSKTLDICIKSDRLRISMLIANEMDQIKEFLSKNSGSNIKLIIAMENTRRYNWTLYEVFAGTNFQVYVIPPLHLKKCMGLVRGKNDKIDAVRIADFIEKITQ